MAKRLRVGVVGLGMGKGHVKGYQAHPRAEVAAVCDLNEALLKDKAAEFGVPETYTDAVTMFKKAGLDAVSIATPNKFHAPLTIAALRQGLHVLCEKPMAMNAREAQKMLDVAKAKKRNLMINFSYRFTSVSRALKAQVDAGVLGEVYFGRTVWHRRRGMPKFGGWFGIKELAGGGPLIDLGVHRLDLALWLMGYPEPVVVSGSAYNKLAAQAAKRANKPFTVEDLACGMVKFANGATLIVEASWALHIKHREHMVTRLCGTKGGLVQRNVDGKYQFEAEIYTDEPGGRFTRTIDQVTAGEGNAMGEFVDSILEKRAPSASGEDGVKVMKILDGIYKSAATGREVRYGKR